jgi:hypothetical protein
VEVKKNNREREREITRAKLNKSQKLGAEDPTLDTGR